MSRAKTMFQKSVLTLMACFVLLTPFGVQAQFTDPAALADRTAAKIQREAIEKPLSVAIIQILLNLISFVANRLAYDAAIAITSGGTGQSPLAEYRTAEEYWQDIGADVAGEAISSLSQGLGEIGIDFDVCAPSDPNLRLNLQLGIASRYQRPEPKCEFRDISSNWEGFIAKHQNTENGSQELLREFSKQFAPGQGTLDSVIGIYVQSIEEQEKQKNLAYQELLANKRFKNVQDVITGNVETPATVLEDQFKNKLEEGQSNQTEALQGALFGNEGALLQIGVSAGSVFLNTLLSQLTNKVYDGLFEAPTSGGVFNPEFIDVAGRARAQETFKSLLTTPIATLDNYNIINEFVVCPGANSRAPNNCVMGTDFAAVIARAEAGQPMTVQEAIDGGLLHGDWPLIPPTDKARNQDAFCYTYGYCYANLVKMRVARILPVGWEMAAQSDQNNEGNPVTLQEVVSAFNDCNFGNPDNLVDAGHPYCRMIDPNWVIKYPETQCRAQVFGQTLLVGNSDQRAQTCVDTPSCLEEDDAGNCVGGYGYCTQERNTWRFGGDVCPEQYASCVTLTSRTGGQNSYLTNTVDYGSCNASNVGCTRYDKVRGLREEGTLDPSDDAYIWSTGTCSAGPAGDTVNPFDACTVDADCLGGGSCVVQPSFDEEDYIFLDADASACDPSNDGCTELVSAASSSLNVIANPSFEQDTFTDGQPDFWSSVGGPFTFDQTSGRFGNASIVFGSSSSIATTYQVTLPPAETTTFSYYARGTASGATTSMTFSSGLAPQVLGGDCALAGGGFATSAITLQTDAWRRVTCTVATSPFGATAAPLYLSGTNARVDGVQVEYTTAATDFHEGYAPAAERTHVRIPPPEIECTGAANDPSACTAYAPSCLATEVGCAAYKPASGTPTVPGIINETDVCPAECSGYETYRQLETNFEDSEFPEYFIASTAESCSAQFAGCDEFTNLDSIAEGGERREYFSDVRVCQEVVEAQNSGHPGTTYYTWEGSDTEGFQLKTWSLKQSNSSVGPCVSFNAALGTCTDPGTFLAPSTCDENADTITNPDCREFYDAEGDVHYRLWSETITVNDACSAYRKTVSTELDCTGSGGVWNAGSGSCAYNIMPSESLSCPAAQNGCRGYTGNAGSNTRIVFQDFFESGSLNGWYKGSGSGTVTYSNDSLAPTGHSLRVQSASAGPFAMMAPSCTPAAGETTCTLTDPVSGRTCRVPESDDTVACGDVAGGVRAGLAYMVNFWARGSGEMNVFLADGISPTGETEDIGTVSVSPGWQAYAVGPLYIDPLSDLDASTSNLFFEGANAYIDNITLTEMTETVYRIEDSWATPSTCDQTAEGLPAPQLHLGCQAYKDQDSDTLYLKSFSSLCREQAIGCSAFYDTQNSESPFASAHQVTCENDDADGDGAPDVATAPTVCEGPFGVDACSIAPGESSCTYSFTGPTPPGTFDAAPPNDLSGIASELVPSDEKIYLVDRPQYHCAEQAAGCMILGNPEFASRTFTGGEFTSPTIAFGDKAVINDPDSYNTTLCEEEELFCEAWSSADRALYYFRDPAETTCEYKQGVEIGGTRYDGWFQTGTDAPCYSSYLVGGTSYGIWRNGDAAYTGLVGTCPAAQNMCSEFIDTADTQAGAFPDGRPYYFIRNGKITEQGESVSRKCEGLISQKEGCVGFDDTSIPFHTFNASASYARSIHADEFDAKPQFSPVPPVNCNNPDLGDGELELADGTPVNLCQRRCAYPLVTGGTFESPVVTVTLGDSCLVSSDCPVVIDAAGTSVNGTCTQPTNDPAGPFSAAEENKICESGALAGQLCDVDADCGTGALCEPVFAANINLSNDSNTVFRVDRDRTCAEWLACDSEYTTWSADQGRYINVCESVSRCNEFTNTSDSSFCSSWIDRDKEILDEETYANRDATWYGLEPSGYSVPNQYAVEHYEQINLNPSKWCVNSSNQLFNPFGVPTDFNAIVGAWSAGVPGACETDPECAELTGDAAAECSPSTPDFRLAVQVGPCLDGAQNGTSCIVGVCAESGAACANNADCSVLGDEVCVLVSADTENGVCYNSSCLQNIDGRPLASNLAEQNECRGYPEQNSPFPNEIVTDWKETPAAITLAGLDPKENTPRSFRSGFSHAKTCAQGEVCECSYKTVEYGTGGVRKLYVDYGESGMPSAVCNGGSLDGRDCSGAVQDCTDGGGKCEFITSEIQRVGWFGYCIQRDGSMTILADPDKNACLLWLPVDQLFGSTDLNNKFTTAGFPITNTAYCTDTELYVDLYPTGVDVPGPDATTITPACAESYRASDTPANIASAGGLLAGDPMVALIMAIAASADVADNGAKNAPSDDPTDAGAECNVGDWDNCWNSVACPKNFFAVIGACNDSSCQINDGVDKDCPYFCVPEGSLRVADSGSFDIGTECTAPSGIHVPINSYYGFGTSEAELFSESTWGGDVPDDYSGSLGYLVSNISDYIDRYKTCSVQGVPFEPYEDGDMPDTAETLSNKNWFLPLNPTIGSFFNDFPTNDYASYYLGCAEVAFASVESGYGNTPGQVGNTAFTNRALSPNGDVRYATEGGSLTYRTSTQPPPVGRIVQTLGFVDGFGPPGPVINRRLQIPTLTDQAPVIVQACLAADQLSVDDDTVTLSDCSVYPEDGENMARGYQQLSVSLPGAAVDQDNTCTPGDVCSGGNPGGATCDNGNSGNPDPWTGSNDKHLCFIGCGEYQIQNNDAASGFDDGSWSIEDGTAFCASLGLGSCAATSVPDSAPCNASEEGAGCDNTLTNYVCSRYYGHFNSNNPASTASGPAAENAAQGFYNDACDSAVSNSHMPAMVITSGDTQWTNYARISFNCDGEGGGDAICDDTSDCPGSSDTVYCSSAGVCSVTTGAAGDSIPMLLEEDDREAGISLLQQFFAEFRGFWQFETPERVGDVATLDETGYYRHVSTSGVNFGLPQALPASDPILPTVTSDEIAPVTPYEIDPDIRDEGDAHGFGVNDGEPTAPVVRAVGEICNDSACIEGPENSVSVNGKTGTIFTSEGNFRTDLRFFATTDPNQFPLRQVLVDWGDGTDADDEASWGRGSLSGSTAPDNYYKAHRGLKPDQTPWCTDGEGTAWGLTSLSCETAPFRFQHHYRCTPLMQGFVEGRTCVVDSEGRLNSPCSFGDGLCTFQPRVFVQDNWGYCTGTCDNPASTTDDPQCFGGEVDECNYSLLPTTNPVTEGAPYSDPWVYYDGWISVEP